MSRVHEKQRLTDMLGDPLQTPRFCRVKIYELLTESFDLDLGIQAPRACLCGHVTVVI